MVGFIDLSNLESFNNIIKTHQHVKNVLPGSPIKLYPIGLCLSLAISLQFRMKNGPTLI